MARSKKNKTALGVIGIVALLLLGILVFQPFSLTQGSSLLSLQKVNLQSSFGPLSGPAWVYTFSLGNMAQFARFSDTVTNQQITDAGYSGTERPKNPFTLDVSFDKQECVYDIQKLPVYSNPDRFINMNMNRLYSFDVVKWIPSHALFSFKYDCKLDTQAPISCGQENLVQAWVDVTNSQCIAICALPVGEIGTISSPTINSQFTINVGENGQTTASKTFSTAFQDVDTQTTQYQDVRGLVNDKVYINWQGNLGTGSSCPQTKDVTPLYIGSSWLLYPTYAIQSYITARDSFTTTSSSSPSGSTTYDQAMTWRNKANDNLQAIRNNVQSFGTVTTNSSTAGRVFSKLASPINYPVITAYVKADNAVIVTPVGIPKITKVEAPCFRSPDGVIKVTVQNIGTERGTFTVGATCSSGGFIIESGTTPTVQPGETQIATLTISGETNLAELKGDCTAVATGINESQKSTTNFQACVSGVILCQAGVVGCDSSTTPPSIRACNPYGTGYSKIQDCADGCDMIGNQPTCITPNGTQHKCGDNICEASEKLTCPQDCGNVTECKALVLGLVPGSVAEVNSCGFWCCLGFSKPTTTLECQHDYTMLIVVIVVLIIAGMFYIKSKSDKKQGGGLNL